MIKKTQRNPEQLIAAIIVAQIILFGGLIGVRRLWGARQPPLPAPRKLVANNSALLRSGTFIEPNTFCLVEFGDYQCPPCAASDQEVQAFLKQHPEVQFQFRHMPLTSIHDLAMSAALLAESARKSGKFQKVHEALYGLDANLTKDNLRRISEHYSLENPSNIEQYKIAHDMSDAERLGVEGTPTFVFRTTTGEAFVLSSLEKAQDFLR